MTDTVRSQAATAATCRRLHPKETTTVGAVHATSLCCMHCLARMVCVVHAACAAGHVLHALLGQMLCKFV